MEEGKDGVEGERKIRISLEEDAGPNRVLVVRFPPPLGTVFVHKIVQQCLF